MVYLGRTNNMTLKVCQVYKRTTDKLTKVFVHRIDHIEISFIQKIDEKNAFTKKLLDNIEYLNAIAIKGEIKVTSFANNMFVDGSIKLPPDAHTTIYAIVNCLDAIESFEKQ